MFLKRLAFLNEMEGLIGDGLHGARAVWLDDPLYG